MTTFRLLLNILLLAGLLAGRMACAQAGTGPAASALATTGEMHLRNVRQLTNLNAASFAPSFSLDGKRIICAPNLGSTGGMGSFELYAINLDGIGLEQITFSEGFDGFPMLSPDGTQLVWISHRNGKAQRKTNVFLADWVP